MAPAKLERSKIAAPGPDLMLVNIKVSSRVLRHIRIILLREKFTLESVMNRAGYSKNLLSRWFNGMNSPRLSVVEDIAHALGYEIVLVPIEGYKYDDGSEPQPIYGGPTRGGFS